MSEKEVAVCLEHRFYRVGDVVYTALSFPYSYWEEYLQYFDHINVVARVKQVERVEDGFVRASGENISFSDIPYYVGLKSFIRMIPILFWRIGKVVAARKYFLLRSGNISNIAFIFIILFRKKYIREYPGNIKEGIVGLAGDAFLYRGIASFSHWFARFQGRFSIANSFVSEYCRTLYGSSRPGFVFSSFNSDEIKIRKESYESYNKDGMTLISVGRLEREKGHLSLLQAMNSLKDAGVSATLTLIGDGREREILEHYASEHSIDVRFLGSITDRSMLFAEIISSDVFVIPSLTEGMPRALLEAMALGMPCVGSKVGGVPEVLDESSMVPPGEVAILADRLLLLLSPEYRRISGKRNHDYIVEEFSNSALRKKRNNFWSMLYE